MSDEASDKKGIKVTDKRLFTAEGELRDEYRFLDEEKPAPATGDEAGAETGPQEAEERRPPQTAREEPEASAPSEEPRPSGPPGQPGFLELVGALAEPVALYLGDARLPDGESAQNLEMARFYIDLLETLRDKTRGNLAPQEKSILDDLLYQLRMRYVQLSS